MKIGIVTVHDSANFGSFLQAYALKTMLTELNHDVCFFVTRDKKYVRSLFYHFSVNRYSLLHPIQYITRILYGIKKHKLFKQEQECFKEIQNYSEFKPDVVILGSDEIWNINTPVFNYDIFYGIGMKNVFSYAVSIGLAKTDDFKGKDKICSAIKQLDKISVRDENTLSCVKTITGSTPEMVCDPTFLIDKELYIKPSHKYKSIKNKYILIYTYEPEEKTKRVIKEFAKRHNLKLLSPCFYYSWCDINLVCSPLDFCEIIKNADYVITTTYHGSIFSALNHKKFVSIPVSPKTSDVLNRIGLNESLISFENLNMELLDEKLVNCNYDYKIVDEKINEMRKHSKEYLERMLEKYTNENM